MQLRQKGFLDYISDVALSPFFIRPSKTISGQDGLARDWARVGISIEKGIKKIDEQTRPSHPPSY